MYCLFKSEVAAQEAAAQWIASVRKGWDLKICSVPEVNPGFLAPAHRCAEAAGKDRAAPSIRRTVEEFERLGYPTLQWDGRPLAGLEVEASGPFARGDEPYAGEAAAFFWAAWPVSS